MNGIMKYINRISRCNGVVYANRLRGYGITQCQHPYILLICREPGIPQEKISRELCVNKSSVTRQITLMEEKGLIRRQILNGNRRSFHIFMTEEGKKKQQLVSEAFSEIERKAVEGISKEEMEGFLSVYQKIYANLLDEAGSSSINKKTDQ